MLRPPRFLLIVCWSAALAAPTASAAQQHLTLPGAAPFPPALYAAFKRRLAAMGPNYRPRTRHLTADGRAMYTNRLFLETSPYLLQHAHNPVNWYPWGDEAFEVARKTHKPVFLSIGYSTCHWCHVMEEESFEDEEIARTLNENYVAIKVDREERPDLDSIYITAVTAMTGRGGWPMTLWLTPDRKPYYGGTYFPARDGDHGQATGLLTLLRVLRKAYDTNPDVAVSADRLVAFIRRNLAPQARATEPPADTLHTVLERYSSAFDSVNGGLRGAPKFPATLPLRLLLRAHDRLHDSHALEMTVVTLEHMARGGIYDQIGGGFHRYSTDDGWRIPHFEKMLYDNAQLAVTYLEAWQATQRDDFLRIVREILAYADRDMSAPDGGFYSATDADSPAPGGRREEGRFFTWTDKEIRAVLTDPEYRLVVARFGITPQGNLAGRNVLRVARATKALAADFNRPEPEITALLEHARARLFEARQQRPAPDRDEKILTAWNGLMISAFARAGLILQDPQYLRRAAAAASFIMSRLYHDGRLQRSLTHGRPGAEGYLDDYASMIRALLDLYEGTGRLTWFQQALSLDETLHTHFEDRRNGGFFLVSDQHEALLAREKPQRDDVIPSGNAIEMGNLLRFYEFTTDDRYRERAASAFRAFGDTLKNAPTMAADMLRALDFYQATPREIVIVTPHFREEAAAFLKRLGPTYLPDRVLSVVTEGKQLHRHEKYLPILEDKRAVKGRTTAYVCAHWVCQLPTTDPVEFARQIRHDP